jgi:hypothetical protein
MHSWLPLTEQWISRQIAHIRGVEQIVLADDKDAATGEIVNTFYNPRSQSNILDRIRTKAGLPDAFRKRILKAHPDNILFSHFGQQGYLDLGLPKKKHITRFYGYDLLRTMNADTRWKRRYERRL